VPPLPLYLSLSLVNGIGGYRVIHV
jgi:hypothetical protein